MPVRKETVRARRAAATRSTSKVARTAKARTGKSREARSARGRTRSKTMSQTAKSRVVVVRGPRKEGQSIWQLGPDGFVVKIAGIRGVVQSAWVFGS
ncbi:MAG TPA: hypothetical protein VM118_11855 [Acidobacteriota bacterium]|nr:hypothetical protein [Acidobacteriota bacterium]